MGLPHLLDDLRVERGLYEDFPSVLERGDQYIEDLRSDPAFLAEVYNFRQAYRRDRYFTPLSRRALNGELAAGESRVSSNKYHKAV